MKSNTDVRVTRKDALADAFERFGAYRYTDGVGFAFHGPMGVEALSTLGHDDLVAGWAEEYKARHAPIDAPPPVARLDPDDDASWLPALGDPARVSDWAALFADQLRDHPWRTVVRRWVPRLVPGYAGALTHGLLRVAHDVRAMPAQGAPDDVLLAELTLGLAYWAATFRTLLGSDGPGLDGPGLDGPGLDGRGLDGTLSLDAAIAGLPRPTEPWSPIEAGTFSRIDELAGFPAAVAALAPPPPSLDDGLGDLTAAFCRVLLANPEVFPQGPVHAVTPVAAVRTLVPYLPDAVRDGLYARMWRTGAAIVCGFTPGGGGGSAGSGGRPAGDASRADDGDVPALDDVLARAVEHRDPHAIKFAEACAREHARRPDPVYLRAARHVLDRTPRW
jgi:hypothetical protein